MKERDFFANACSVCYATENIKRCSRCQMISYCNLNHQKKDWPEHKQICKAISALMEEIGVSHLFEKLKGSRFSEWIFKKTIIMQEVEKRLYRNLTRFEQNMFKYPRSCFICYESKQTLLKSCPGCPEASFCAEHFGGSIHDDECAKLKQLFELHVRNENDADATHLAIFAVLEANKVFNPSRLPTSIREFMFEFPTSPIVSEDMKILLTDLFSVVFTVFNSFQKLDFSPGSELAIHAYSQVQCAHAWELLLHLYPQLKVLKILLVNFNFHMNKETITLCSDCRKKGRQIIIDSQYYEAYFSLILSKKYKKPDVLINCDLIVPDQLKFVNILSDLNFTCPLIITTVNDVEHEMLVHDIKSGPKCAELFFEGENPFKSLVNFRSSYKLVCSNDFVIIIKPRKNAAQKVVRKAPHSETEHCVENGKFYSNICHVCGSSETSVTCKRCKMISYCGKNHQHQHQNQHKELCRAILGILNENGASNIFDKSKTEDSSLWMKTKLDLMSRVESKLKRGLSDFEKEMFLFPKTCFICHESDSNALVNCKCGINLCKIHKNDQMHVNLCDSFFLAFELTTKKRLEIPTASVKILNNSGNSDAYVSMEKFIDSFLRFENETDNKIKEENNTDESIKEENKTDKRIKEETKADERIKEENKTDKRIKEETKTDERIKEENKTDERMKEVTKTDKTIKEENKTDTFSIEKMIISNVLTRPLTFLWILENLNYKDQSKLIVHVIGATNSEVSAQQYWKLILFRFQKLKSLKIIFIGPEIEKSFFIEKGLEFDKTFLEGQTLEVESHTLKYEEYFQSESFIRPNFIIGFNLHLHESELGVVNHEWKDMILILKKIDAPFILTAGTENRALKDHKIMCTFSETIVDFLNCNKNPFAGLIPERDFETEKLLFSNQYVFIYKGLCEEDLQKLQISEESLKSSSQTNVKEEIVEDNKSQSKIGNEKKKGRKRRRRSGKK